MNERIDKIEKRLNRGDQDFTDMRREIKELHGVISELTRKINDMSEDMRHTREIITYWNNLKGFSVTMRILWGIVKWLAAIVSMCIAIYYFGKTGVWKWA